MNRPRVMLVEDDASLQRFVQLVLEDMAIELLCCASVDEALAALAEAPVQLILTDLMLPLRSGFALIEALAGQPGLLGGARLVVFSAGLTPDVRERLQGPTVWRLLSKPCSVAELQACVAAGLQRPAAAPAAATEQAVSTHFGGNALLYQAFRAGSLQQFALDIVAGDQACETGDAAGLRRLAHNLKSVLVLLGHPAEAAEAQGLDKRLEQAGTQAMDAAAAQAWQSLRGALIRLAGVSLHFRDK